MRPFLPPILLLLTAACQPMPPPMPLQPTAEEKNLATALLPQDAHGIWLQEIRDLPLSLSAPLRATIARTLQDDDIPIAVRDTAQNGILLRGQARIAPLSPQEADVEITWSLTSVTNETLHSFNQRYLLPWDQLQSPDQGTLDRIARAVAPPLLSKLSATARAGKHLQGIALGEISGAPGDGRVALKRSLEFLFKENGIPVVEAGGGDHLTVTAEVDLDAPARDRQRIRVRWRLILPDGTEFGTVDQENQIPAGSLDKTWGETAFFSAEGAFEGLAALLEKAPPLVSPPASQAPPSFAN